jgi:CubicO group peptidase (beta-lactamase class C family)
MMTIRDLLCHRSGLGTFSGDVIWYRSEYTAEEVVKRTAELPNEFEFRNGFGYSNVMYLAAGEVIRAVTGKTWAQYVQQKFLDPLGMNRTITSTNAIPSIGNVATPHKPEGQANNPIPWVNWDNMGAAGGIISSVSDMTKWLQFQLQHGIIGTDTVFTTTDQRTMWTPQVSFPVGDKAREFYGNRNFNGYGLGWSTTEYFGHQMVSHTGGYDGMYSAVVLLPADQTGVVVLTNSMTSIGMNLCYEVLDKLLRLPQKDWKERGVSQDKAHWNGRAARIKERTDAREKGTTPSMSVTQITGLYRCPMFGDINIRNVDGQLMIDFVRSPDLKAKLTHWHNDTYQLEWVEEQAWFEFGTVQVEQDNNGSPRALRFDVPNDDIFFEEIKAVRLNP